MPKFTIEDLQVVFGWDAEKAAVMHERIFGPAPELTGASKELFGRELEPYVPPPETDTG